MIGAAIANQLLQGRALADDHPNSFLLKDGLVGKILGRTVTDEINGPARLGHQIQDHPHPKRTRIAIRRRCFPINHQNTAIDRFNRRE